MIQNDFWAAAATYYNFDSPLVLSAQREYLFPREGGKNGIMSMLILSWTESDGIIGLQVRIARPKRSVARFVVSIDV